MANTELPQPELPGVVRVTPAGVTLVVVGEPTLMYITICTMCIFAKLIANRLILGLLLIGPVNVVIGDVIEYCKVMVKNPQEIDLYFEISSISC